MNPYTDKTYKNRHEKSLYSAETILTLIQKAVPEIRSAVDIGCGVGTWLYVLKQRGATDVCGVDGSWVNKDFLKIKNEDFIEHDLGNSTNLDIERTFDLAISLEVAEHLPPNSAKEFVFLLTSLSDFVLFSAAIPNQGGVGHINEQWANYWISLFQTRGYFGLDVIRKNIWNDELIAFWYRQNVLLFVNKERIPDLKLRNPLYDHIPPEVYLLHFEKAVSPGIRQSFNGLLLALRRRILKIF
jgi:SAM-dependent methyltransferase